MEEDTCQKLILFRKSHTSPVNSFENFQWIHRRNLQIPLLIHFVQTASGRFTMSKNHLSSYNAISLTDKRKQFSWFCILEDFFKDLWFFFENSSGLDLAPLFWFRQFSSLLKTLIGNILSLKEWQNVTTLCEKRMYLCSVLLVTKTINHQSHHLLLFLSPKS